MRCSDPGTFWVRLDSNQARGTRAGACLRDHARPMTLHRSQCKITWSHLWSEPFRVFFPAGLAIGMVGVSLWPAYYAGLLSFYPGVAHARLMIQGFMASFIVGFLGTAVPRITSTRPFSRVEVLTLLTLDLFAVGLHCGAANRAGCRRR